MTQVADRPGLLDVPSSRISELTVEVRDGARVLSKQVVSGHAIIGRATDAQVRLDRGTVSRQHAEILCDPFGRWWIRDMGSRNGLILGGRRVQERAIRDGDQFQIGDFFVMFRITGIEEDTADHPTTAQTTIVPVSDIDTPAGISTAQDLGSTPRIAASHLSAMLETGRELMQADAAEGRLIQLCQLMLKPEFKGTCAMALRVSASTLDTPQMLCPVQTQVGHGSRPPVSRSLLRIVMERNAPAMAGNQLSLSHAPEMVEMSMMTSLHPMCAIACPLRAPSTPGAPMDLLYVIFPPECGTGEWLAITALATEQYRLAESAWAARHEAMRHAAVERDLEQARQIQLRLVPGDLQTAGLEVVVGFEPCRWVGGDYTDAAALPDGRVLLAVADVCGKGLGAALVSSSVHTLIRAMMFDSGVSLGQMMQRLNRHMIKYLDDGQFVTMACALLDPATGAVEHANAGHPPVILVDTCGGIRDLPCGENLPLGVDDEPFNLYTDRLGPGEMLAMYTDGLTEARMADGEMVGHSRLRDQFGAIHAACIKTPLREARGRVSSWLESVCGGRLPDDDRTYLLARRE
jgi:serine phosphatase RsbU (regulator of sigma subunit)/pSer/pThr/pTyr-binding forkhead associated (FHA) protein